MRIYAIIVTYNGKKWYDRCISSLLNSSVPISVIIVDNNSFDDSVNYLSTTFPTIHIIQNSENVGFAKANNVGIKYAIENGADYVFLLNQDAWVEKQTIELLLQTFLDNNNVGIASPMHLNGSYSGLDSGFCEYAGPFMISDLYRHEIKRYYELPFVNAAAWLISKECIRRVGGFDISLFKHYGEDDNYAQRVRFHKMKIIVNTKCTMCHDREQRESKPLNSTFNINDAYYFYKSQKSNILLEHNSLKVIKKLKKKLFKAYLGFHIKRSKRLKFELELERQIAFSREINKREGGGEIWLE